MAKIHEMVCGKKDVEIIELEDAYNIKDMIFLSLEFDQIIIPERFQTTELYNIHFSLLPKYRGVIHRFFLFYTMRNIQALHCIRSGLN